MNLFENLQMLNESENKLVSEFRDFLKNKNAQYIANEIGETKDGMQIVIYDGDWKHEHLYMQRLINEFFENKGIDVSITSEEIGESDQDTYSAKYNIEFNAKPNAYSADITPLKFTTENIDTSNWKPRFKGMDVFISDKNPGYQIKKSYNGFGKEVWAVFKFEWTGAEGKRVFVGSSFEAAVDFVENGKRPRKPKALDNIEESPSYGGAFDISDTAYFTRDDLDEFSNDVVEKLSNATHADIIADVVECYLDEDTNELELTLSYDEYEHTHKEKIDMRKIKMPKDLIKVYSNNFVNDFLWSFTADMEHEEMIKESDEIDTFVTFEDIKQQLDAIDSHPYLKIYYDENPFLNTCSVTIEGTLINGESICFYDSSFLKTQSDIDFIKEQYAKASKEIDNMRKRGYLGVKDESSKIEETSHNEILDTDYVTGEKLFNAIKDYLDSLDQIGMDGNDYNWQPSEFNAKNLEADGEIYLVNKPYILFYPYINEWAEDYFKVSVVESNELSTQLKNGIERIFNKFKTDKWQLIFEG